MKNFPSTVGAMAVSLTVLAGCFAAADQRAPAAHPKKVIYQDQKKWPPTTPADVTLQNFRPFRAVYVRQYIQGSGPHAGEPRSDRVIVTAESVGWDGMDAVMIHLIDSGIPDKSDTNARTATMIVAKKDLHLLFEIGPMAGTAKNYYIINVLPEKIVGSMVTSTTPALEPRIAETSDPGFGPTTWAFAHLDLAVGDKVRLDPSLSPLGNPLSPAAFGRVLGRETFTDLEGRTFDNARVIEMVTSMTNERSLHVFTCNTPPYYLGTASWNMDTDRERNKFVWLKEFMYLDDGSSDGVAR